MKIALFGPAFPFRGGVPHFTGALARALETAGHEAAVINFEKLSPSFLFPGRSQYDDSPHAIIIDSERVFVPWRPGSWKKTAEAIAAHDPDLILAAWWLPYLGPGYRGVAMALPEKYRARLVYLVHDVVSHERRPLDAFLARRALTTATRFLTLSQSQADLLQRTLPEKHEARIAVTPHPLFEGYATWSGGREEARKLLNAEAPRVLLFFGFVRHYKGLDLLIRALPAILDREPGTKLLVCGPFHEARSEYDALIAKLGLQSQIVIHDRYFSGEEVGLCFTAADAVVLPYRSATQTGVVPIAYALNVPVIATAVGGLGEVVKDGETGGIIPEVTPEAIAASVVKFYDAGGAAAYADGIRREAARYTWDTFIEKLTTILERP